MRSSASGRHHHVPTFVRSSPSRSRRTLAMSPAPTNIDDLLEENLSLKYQVQKLQAVLSQGVGVTPSSSSQGQGQQRQVSHAVSSSSSRSGGGSKVKVDEEKKFQHQIKKLQVFMNNHSNQAMVLKERLKEASDYVQSLEGKEERDFTPPAGNNGVATKKVSKLRKKSAKGSPVPASTVHRHSSGLQHTTKPLSKALSSTQQSAPATSRNVLRDARKRSKAPVSSRSVSKTSKTDTTLGITSGDLEYIFDEVVNLKQKLALAESKLQHANAAVEGIGCPNSKSIRPSASSQASISNGPDQETLRREMVEMKENQQTLIRQIRAQQEVISDIFDHLSVSGIAPGPGIRLKVREDTKASSSSSSSQGKVREESQTHRQNVYRTRQPIISMQPTVRLHPTKAQKKRLNPSKPRGFTKAPDIVSSHPYHIDYQEAAERKFAHLASAGFTGAGGSKQPAPKIQRALDFSGSEGKNYIEKDWQDFGL